MKTRTSPRRDGPAQAPSHVARRAHKLTAGPGGLATRTIVDIAPIESHPACGGLDATILAAVHQLVCVADTVPADELASAFVDLGASGAAVVDARGELVGVATKSDLARVSARGDSVSVRDAMTPSHFSLPETASLGEAAALMAWKGVHRVPVVTSLGEVLGVIGALDVIRWLAPPHAAATQD